MNENRSGGGSPGLLGFGHRRRAPALKSDGGDDAVAPGGDGVVDDVRKTMAVSKT
jgi:hypothetical protein